MINMEWVLAELAHYDAALLDIKQPLNPTEHRHLCFRKMKLLLRSNPQTLWHRSYDGGVSHLLKALFFSTNTVTSASSSAPADTLYRRVSLAQDRTASIIPVVQKWIEEGHALNHHQVQFIIKQLRKFGRFGHALEISQWVHESKKIGHVQSSADVAIRLDLISKTHGLDEAEKYFNGIPDSLRSYHVYGALLKCYVSAECLEKAEAHLQKMREMGILSSALSYNVMLKCYSQMGKYEELDILLQEMENKGIQFDLFTYSIKLNAYVATSNVEEMEKLLMKMEADPHITIDWNAYAIASNGYLKAGLVDKSLAMLRRAEELIGGKTKKLAYEIILTSYGAVGKKEDVYRIWNLCKNVGKFYNSSYLSMISTLLKIDDIEGAEGIWEEWLSVRKTFVDIRIPHILLSAVSKKGLWEKAEACVNKMTESGIEPDHSTMDHLATAYQLGGQMEKAIEAIKQAISISKRGWKPNAYTLAACLRYLKDKGDVQQADELLSIIEHCRFSKGIHKKLKSCAKSGSLENRVPDQMEDDDETLVKESN